MAGSADVVDAAAKRAGKLRMKQTESDRRRGTGDGEGERRQRRRRYSSDGESDVDEERRRARRLKREQREQRRAKRSHQSKPGPSRYFEPSPEPSLRRTTGQDGDEDADSDAYVPPRPSKDRPYVPYSYNDDDDESRLPPSSSHKRHTDYDTQHDEHQFREKLFSAMRDDEGFDPYSTAASNAGLCFDYRERDMPDQRRFGTTGVYDDRYVDPVTGAIINRVIFKEAMTDEEYAEHIRRGMFRRTRREELARQEELEKLRKEKAKRHAENIARTRALEEERIRQLEERAKRKTQQGLVKTREEYQNAWSRLTDAKGGNLRMHDFPWPVSKQAGGELSKASVLDFLVAHLSMGKDGEDVYRKKRRLAVRTAVLAYHPDRFERYLARVVDERERESVREMARG
ncbi:hypothetical protein EMMF5_005763 [Cystobasidiomycetes sp. EMM_F5]